VEKNNQFFGIIQFFLQNLLLFCLNLMFFTQRRKSAKFFLRAFAPLRENEKNIPLHPKMKNTLSLKL